MNTVTEPLVRLAARVDAIQPFYVMELAKEAAVLERQGRDIIHMGIMSRPWRSSTAEIGRAHV